MKKVLWVCNVPIPKIAYDMGIKAPYICGWLTGFADLLEKQDGVKLIICFPQLNIQELYEGSVDRIEYYAFSQPRAMKVLPAEDQVRASRDMREHIEEIIRRTNPDILHVFGTEYPHSLVAIQAFNRSRKTVINIQGLTSFYWMHFNNGIQHNYLKKFTISNLVRGNLLNQANQFKKRGGFEVEAIKRAGHVIGRTDWDHACTTQINPDVAYHFCNESLRESFYEASWDYDKCEKYSLFMSQASTPIKGLQFMLRALPEITRHFPKVHLYIAGNNLIQGTSIYDRVKQSIFAKYIKKLIKDLDIGYYVTFTGSLSELEMKERFLKSNVFIMPSTVENSPNSLGEAMLLGMPCVASDVGGVKNMLVHEKEGYVYQGDAPYMLAYYIKRIFKDNELATRLGSEAQKHAKVTHNRQANLNRLVEIYDEIHLIKE